MMTAMDTRPAASTAGTSVEAGRPPGSRDVSSLPASDLSVLVHSAQEGDEHAFRAVYRAIQPGLLRYLRALVGDEAEDIASETWLQIVRDLGAFRGGGTEFRSWSATIARHRALDHLRARGRRPQLLVPIEALNDRVGAPDAATVALDAMSTREAIALIATLPREQAEAVLLRVVVGLDADGVGRVLGKRAGAVRTSAYRGLRRLNALLDQRRTESTGDRDASGCLDA
jgi:RNA polymerase sigma-70 factor (ECF subfamily)